jgi:tripartite-type tricarboxylate transporter receptor subunit TctC
MIARTSRSRKPSAAVRGRGFKDRDEEFVMRTLQLLSAALASAALIFAAHSAGAQTYPDRPIQVIVPFAGGSASDVVTRIILDRMSKSLGQPMIIDNRPGAGGNTGTAAGAKVTPDGYTLIASGSGPIAANRTLYRDLGYDPEKDFEAISPFAFFNIVVVASNALPVKTLPELIAYAKDHPGLNYGSVGIGSSQHLAGVYFGQVTGLKFTHVPYRNIAQYGPDLISGAVPLGFQWLPNVSGPLGAKGARPLAVASKTRMAALPDVPTTAEAGLPQYEASGWFAMLAPRGTPKPIVEKLNHELAAAAQDPGVRQRFAEQGADLKVLPPDESVKFFADEIEKWRNVIVKAGIPQIQ